ncbi:MAG TPA: signal peptidase I [Caulobacteraceae bacterium]
MTGAGLLRGPSLNRVLITTVVVIGVVTAVALAVWVGAFKPYSLPTVSMQPGLQRGDYMVMMRKTFTGPPRRGDVIVFALPSSGDHEVDYVKRLIGMPGDRVQLKGGRLFINDKPVQETPLGVAQGDLPEGRQPVKLYRETTPEGRSYQIELAPGFEAAGDTAVYAVPPHCYFVLGDNRDNSVDSRFDPGLAPDDPALGGCGWNEAADRQVGEEPGVGFVADSKVRGAIVWSTSQLRRGRADAR